jgi:hypothetical protein
MGRSGLRPSRHRLLRPSSLTFYRRADAGRARALRKRASSLLDSACSLSQRTHSASQGRQARRPVWHPSARAVRRCDRGAHPCKPARGARHGLERFPLWLSAEPLRIRPCATDKRSRRCCLSLSSQQRTLRGYVRRARPIQRARRGGVPLTCRQRRLTATPGDFPTSSEPGGMGQRDDNRWRPFAGHLIRTG